MKLKDKFIWRPNRMKSMHEEIFEKKKSWECIKNYAWISKLFCTKMKVYFYSTFKQTLEVPLYTDDRPGWSHHRGTKSRNVARMDAILRRDAALSPVGTAFCQVTFYLCIRTCYNSLNHVRRAGVGNKPWQLTSHSRPPAMLLPTTDVMVNFVSFTAPFVQQ